jgi:Protein of unknown function (DUF433)
MLANGDSIDGLLKAYPSIELADILACLDYAALLAEEQITPIVERYSLRISVFVLRLAGFGSSLQFIHYS